MPAPPPPAGDVLDVPLQKGSHQRLSLPRLALCAVVRGMVGIHLAPATPQLVVSWLPHLELNRS